jgi:hypothetical protein
MWLRSYFGLTLYAWLQTLTIGGFWMLLCPSQSYTKRRSAPASGRCVAIVCLSTWKWRFCCGSLAAHKVHSKENFYEDQRSECLP